MCASDGDKDLGLFVVVTCGLNGWMTRINILSVFSSSGDETDRYRYGVHA